MNENEHSSGLKQARALTEYDAAHYLPAGAKSQRTEEIAQLDAEIARVESVRSEKTQDHAYTQLCAIFFHIIYLNSVGNTCDWLHLTKNYQDPVPDERIVNDDVVEQAMSALARSAVQLISAPNLKELFAEAAKQSLKPLEQRNLELMHRQWVLRASIPEQEEVAWSTLRTQSASAWDKLKREWRTRPATDADYAVMQPFLTQIFEMAARRGAAFAKQLRLATPYEGLLAELNPDLSLQQIDEVYARMREMAPKVIAQAQAAQAKAKAIPPPRDGDAPAIPVTVQRALIQKLGDAMGFDFNRGRVDISAHPFTTDNLPDDKRVTVAYKDADSFSAIFAAMHEFGHALYEQALPKDLRGEVIGLAHSTWLHESQSMFWDHHIAMTPEFYEFLQPLLAAEMRKAFPQRDFSGPAWSAANLYRLATEVKPDFIRVDADAATYPLHLVLRDIEREIINAPNDKTRADMIEKLPQTWNARAKELLGIDVPDVAKGCLQDTHWPSGLVGYFPGYIFGTVAAAQMKGAMEQGELPDLKKRIRSGDFKTIASWLRSYIQQKASTEVGEQIIQQATGAPLNGKSVDRWADSLREMLIVPAK